MSTATTKRRVERLEAFAGSGETSLGTYDGLGEISMSKADVRELMRRVDGRTRGLPKHQNKAEVQ